MRNNRLDSWYYCGVESHNQANEHNNSFHFILVDYLQQLSEYKKYIDMRFKFIQQLCYKDVIKIWKVIFYLRFYLFVFIIKIKCLYFKYINIQKILYENQMEYQNEKISLDISNTISKIDQLLRLYQMIKKSDVSKKNTVQVKINSLVSLIRSQAIYKKIQPLLSKYISNGLQQAKAPIKVQRQISNASLIKSSNNISIQKSKDKQIKVVSQSSIFNNQVSEQNSKNKNKMFGSMQGGSSSGDISQNKKQNNTMTQKKFQAPSQHNSSAQMSNQKSQDSFQMMIESAQIICQKYENKIQDILAINDDIFTSIKQTEDFSYIYLFGINNPEKNYKKKFYICTLMKFSSFQVMSCNESVQSKFNKQYTMFNNNLRSPFGLIMCGKSIQEIKVQHIKFLADLNAPSPVIILLQNFRQKLGTLYQFDKKTVKQIKQLNKIQYEQQTSILQKQYAKKGVSISKVQVVKQKVVITKNLARAITNSIQSAPNAIQIQSGSQCIKQQPNRFPYKLHTKYYVSPKSDYQLFFLDNQIMAFKMSYKEKQFELFKKFVFEQAHQKGKFLLSTSVLKQAAQIKKQFFKLLQQCKTRDQYFLVNLSGIANKKTLILSLKQNISEDDINNAPAILFNSLQKQTQITNVVAVITKQNYKLYETDSKVEVIDLTERKR